MIYTFLDCPRSSLQDDVMLTWVWSRVTEYQWVFQNNAKCTLPKLEAQCLNAIHCCLYSSVTQKVKNLPSGLLVMNLMQNSCLWPITFQIAALHGRGRSRNRSAKASLTASKLCVRKYSVTQNTLCSVVSCMSTQTH